MIRQHDKCVDREGIALASSGDRLAQSSDMVDQQGLLPIQQVYREEPPPAWNQRATIIRHEAQDTTTLTSFAAGRRITPSANPPYEWLRSLASPHSSSNSSSSLTLSLL